MAITLEDLLVQLKLQDNATPAMQAVQAAMDAVAASGQAASDATDAMGASAAGASAAAATLAKASADAAASINVQDQTITRAGRSADALLRTYDPLEKMNAAVARATNTFTMEQAKANTALAAGAYTQDQYATVMQGAYDRQRSAVQKANDAYSATQMASGNATVALTANAAAADHAGQMHAGFTREVIVLGHEIVTGNYNRIPGSLMVLAERTGGLGDIAKMAFGAVATVPGAIGAAAVVGIAALATYAVSAEDALLATVRLSDQLHATRTDYDTLTGTVEKTAAAFAHAAGMSVPDSRAAAQTLASAPTFGGSSAELQNLLEISQGVSMVWNTSLPDAAKKLAQAMDDPIAAAQQLAKEGFPAVTEATVELVTHLERQGDVMGAQQAVLAAYGAGVSGVTDKVTGLGKAMSDLHKTFGTDAAMNPFAPGYLSPMQRVEQATKAAAFANWVGPESRTSIPDPEANTQAIQAEQQRVLGMADAASSGSPVARTAALRDQIQLLKTAQAAVGDNTEAWAQYQSQIGKDNDELGKLNGTTDKQAGSLQKTVDLVMASILGNVALADAYLKGSDSVLHITAAEKAHQEAIKLYPTNAAAQEAAVVRLTGLYEDQARSASDVKAAQDAANSQEQLDYISKELSLVGATSDVRDHELAVLKERQKLMHDNADLDSEASQAALLYAGRVADATSALQHQQQVVNDLTNMATQAFDQVGSAIANAFTSGSGQAVNFANVFKAAMSSILQEVAKLAIINPILNSILGGSRSTFGDVLSLASSSGSGGGILSSLGSLGGLGGGGGSIMDSLGISSVLDTTLWSSAPSAASTGATAMYGGGLEGMSGVSTSLGGLLGGAGAGFGAGMLVNNLLGGNQQNGMIGSAGGALAGAMIGSIIPGVGTLIGGLIGGAAGGGLGGLIGPGPANHGWNVWDSVSNGQLTTTSSGFDKFDGTSILQGIQSQNASINALVASLGLTMGMSGSFMFGGSNGANDNNNATFFQHLRFSSASNATLNDALTTRSNSGGFTDANDLQNFVTLVGTTIPTLTTNSGSLAAQITALNTTFGNAITAATGYGLSTDALTAAQAKAVQQANDTAAAALGATEQGFAARLAAANGDTTGANLINFDVSATQQRTQLAAQLVGAYGDAYTATADYTRIMGELNTALDAERAVVADAATQTAAGQGVSVISSLNAYTQSLLSGSANPASPMDQFTAAQNQFNAVAGAAVAGDANSLSQLQSYATAYLGAARSVYGSGSGYAAAFGQVTGVLGQVAASSPDVLTASIMAQTAQKNTDQLVAQFQTLIASVNALRTQLGQAVLTPARVAA